MLILKTYDSAKSKSHRCYFYYYKQMRWYTEGQGYHFGWSIELVDSFTRITKESSDNH